MASIWQAAGGAGGSTADAARSSAESATTRVLVGAEADERAFKEAAPGVRVLHLATHGFFLDGSCVFAGNAARGIGTLVETQMPKPGPSSPVGASTPSSPHPLPPPPAYRENPLLLSGLVLAGANRRQESGPGEDDGILTAEEISALNLTGLEWAVLSACETATGEVRSGEGVFGLRRAFQISGARTTIMSLWSVDDEATREWMKSLYEARLKRRLSTAEAVRAACLATLRDRRARGESVHPFFWGAFVAAGDWH